MNDGDREIKTLTEKLKAQGLDLSAWECLMVQ